MRGSGRHREQEEEEVERPAIVLADDPSEGRPNPTAGAFAAEKAPADRDPRPPLRAIEKRLDRLLWGRDLLLCHVRAEL